MGTVKYTGPVASFHCPTEATIRSLKVHFSPKQLGEGTPSPENVREIVGWDGVEVEQRGKNLFDANNPNIITPNCWVSSNAPNKITASGPDRTVYIKCLPNTTYNINKTLGNVLAAGYTTELPATNMQTYSYMRDSYARQVTVITGSDAKYLAIWFYDSSKTYDRTVQPEDIYKTLQVEYGSTATTYEPYHGSTTNYEFGVLGKNKFDPIYKNSDQYTIGGAYGYYYTEPIFLIPNTTYTIKPASSGETEQWYWAVGIYTDTYNVGDKATFKYVFNNGSYGTNYTFTTGLSGVIRYATNNKTKFEEAVQNIDIQLELGDIATTYEPYNPNKTVYGGWVDLVSGEVQEEYGLITVDDSVSIDAPNASGNEPWRHRWSIRKWDYDAGVWYFKNNSGILLCDRLNKVNSATENGQIYGVTVEARIYLYDNEITSVEEFHSKYDGMKLCAPLNDKCKITYNLPLHSTELKTFLSTNNVWSNADYVEVEYDLHETQIILARKQFIVANQPHIVKPAAASLQNFVTDMAAPLKECKIYFSPVQDTSNGAPSPDNICPISGWTGVDVYKAGENLIPIDYAPVEGKWKPTDGVISGSVYNMGQFPVPAAMLYYQVGTTGNAYFGFIDGEIKSGEPVYGVKTVTNVRGTSFDNSDGHKYALITATSESIFDKEIVISVGQGVKPYSEPSGTTFPIDWTSEAGTVYGGYVDLVTGEVWETHHKLLLDGITSGCKCNSDYSNNTYIIGGIVYLVPTGGVDNGSAANSKLRFDRIGVTGSYEAITTIPTVQTITAGSQYLRFYVAYTADHPELDTKQKRIDFCNEFLSSNPITVVYPLQTPQLLTTLTPTQLKTLRGTNNIWSNANGNLEIAYWTH